MLTSPRWPWMVGALWAALMLLTAGSDPVTLATFTGGAALCYVLAAAVRRPWVAWLGIPATALVAGMCEVVGVSRWAGLGVVLALLLIAGHILSAPGRRELHRQAVAALGYGGVVVLALTLEPAPATVVTGLTLAAHGIWDALHLRRHLVAGTFVRTCIALDLCYGLGAIGLVLWTGVR